MLHGQRPAPEQACSNSHKRNKPADIQMDLDNKALVDNLVDWFTRPESGGWLNPDVRIEYDESHGFHVRAIKDLSDAEVATCPLGLTLSYLNLDHEQSDVPLVDSPLCKCLGKIPNHVLTYLLLVEQLTLGSESPWQHYIASLPRQDVMTTPLWFSDDELKYLAGTNLEEAAQERKQELQKDLSHARSVMADVGLGDSTLYEQCDFKNFLWAVTIITSRAFISTHILPQTPTFPLLFPVVDIANHSPLSKVQWDFQPHQSFTLRTLGPQTTPSGSEIFNNYAPKQNDELLMGYGFVIEDNPMEQFALRFQLPDPLHEQVLRFYEPGYVPFGMDTSFCSQSTIDTTPQIQSTHYLRPPQNHPFGTYKNTIPALRPFPPELVFVSYIICLRRRGLNPASISLPIPDPRIVLGTLKFLFEGVVRSRDRLSSSSSSSHDISDIGPVGGKGGNVKKRYAIQYRTLQSKIISSIHDYLATFLSHPRLYTPSSLLTRLSTTDPISYNRLSNGLSTLLSYNPEISTNTLVDERDEEDLLWILILVYSYGLVHDISEEEEEEEDTILSYTRDLLSTYPLPMIDEHSQNQGPQQGAEEEEEGPAYILSLLQSIPSTYENILTLSPAMQKAVVKWAMHVTEVEILVLPDPEVARRKRQCIYLRPSRNEKVAGKGCREDEAWIIRDVGFNKSW